MKKKILLYGLFVLTVVLITFTIGIVYEESATVSRAVSFKGIFTQPITDWPVTQIFISHIYAWLYGLHQNTPWYSIIDYGGVIVSLILFFRIFKFSKQFYLFIPFLVLIIDDLVLFSFTRTAMLLSAAGLFGIFMELNKLQEKKIWFYLKIILLSLLCLHGFFNRPQAFAYTAALFILFLIVAFFIAYQKLSKLRENKFLFTIPFGMVTVFFIIYQTTIPPSIRQAQKLAPIFYNIHSSNYHQSFDNLSKKDSLALALIKYSYVNDLEVMNKEFVDRITQSQPKNYLSISKFTHWDNIQQNIKKYIPFYINYHLYDIILIFAILGYVIISRNYTTRQKVGMFIFVIGSISSLLAVTNIAKMEMRISSPVFLVTFIALIVLMCLSNKKPSLPTPLWLTVLLIGGSIYFGVKISDKLSVISDKQTYHINKNIEFKNKLDTEYNGKTLILSNTSLNIIHRYPFQEFKDKKTFDVQFFEGEGMVYQPTAQKNFIKYCGSLKVEDIYDTMFRRKDETFYLATPKWKELMIDYLEVHYNKRYVMEEFDTLKFHDSRFDDIILYKPIKIVHNSNHD